MPRLSRSEFTARTKRLIANLREEIKTGSLKVGDYLPSEVELGQTYGLNKLSVRRALDELVDDGLIIKIRRVGNRVCRTDSITVQAGNPSSSAGKVVLRLAHVSSLLEDGRLQQAVKAYERMHPNIHVQLISTPFPLEFVEHGIADVVSLSAWDALKLKERDPAMALLGDVPDTEFAHPLLSKPFTTEQGRLIAAPYVYSPVVLCYNRAHFSACQVEEPAIGWTWYNLLKIARTMNRKMAVTGFMTHIQSVNRWPVFLLQNGFRFKSNDNERAAEDPALWESLRISRDLIHQQGASPLWTENNKDVMRWFREGKVSMILTTFFELNRLLNSDLDMGVVSLPALQSDNTLLLVTGMAVNSQSSNLEAARELVSYLCSLEVQTDVRSNTLSLPAHPEALNIQEGLTGNRPQGEAALAQQWSEYRLYSDLNLSTSVLESIRQELMAYWSQHEDEAEAIERLEALLSVQ